MKATERVLSATINNWDLGLVGTFALKPCKFGNEQPGWRGEVTLEIDGHRYITWCLLVPLGEVEEMAREGE